MGGEAGYQRNPSPPPGLRQRGCQWRTSHVSVCYNLAIATKSYVHHPSNFEVTLERSYNSLPSNGKGILTLPDQWIGERFFRWATKRGNGVQVLGRRLWISKCKERVKRGLVEALNKTPWVDPGEEAEREEKLTRIHSLRVILEAIQFGIYFHRPGDPNTAHRYFSMEYEIHRDDTISGELLFDYDHKLFRIEVRPAGLNVYVNFTD